MPSTATTKGRRAPQRYVPDLDTIDSAAQFWRVNPRTVRRMLASGELTAYRIRGQLRVDMNQVRDLATPVAPESVSA